MDREFKKPEFHVSQAIYGRLLRAYPRRHRAEYGAAMAQLFRDQCREAWNESRNWGLLKLWLRVLPDLACTSIMERLAALRERKTMTDKIANLSGFGASPMRIFAKVFLVIFLLVVMASVIVTFCLPDTYASTARIKVENDVINQPASYIQYDPYFIQTTFEIIRSDAVLSPVVVELNLNEKWGKKYDKFGRAFKTAESVEILKNRLELTPVKNTKLIAITVYSDDKDEAAQIANAIVGNYRYYREENREQQMTEMTAQLQQQYEEQERQIQQAQTELSALRRRPGFESNAAATASAPVKADNSGKEQDLGVLLDRHKALLAQIEAAKLDAELPKSSPVQITDRAEPGRAPVKPNKTLNIVLGIFAGVFLATLAGAACALLALFAGKRTRKTTGAT